MAKKRTVSRRYYRRSFRRYKAPSNYFRVKVEYYDRIRFPILAPGSQAAGQRGGPIVFDKRDGEPGDADITLTLQNLMQQYAYTNILQGLFSYYRPTGIRIEVIPESRNSALASTIELEQQEIAIPVSQCLISYRSGSNVNQTLQEVRSNNQSIVLNPNQKVTRYWRVYGTTSAYQITGQYFAGAFTIRNEYSMAADAASAQARSLLVYTLQPSWSIKISIYYLYKYSRA